MKRRLQHQSREDLEVMEFLYSLLTDMDMDEKQEGYMVDAAEASETNRKEKKNKSAKKAKKETLKAKKETLRGRPWS